MKQILVFIVCLLFWSCNSKQEDDFDDELCDCLECDAPVLIECENAHLWDYPVKPGMEEWKQLHSTNEMVCVTTIPRNLFNCLSTEDLLDLCLRYPLFGNITAFDDLDMGLDALFSYFNGIQELYQREDVSYWLNKRYMEEIYSLQSCNCTDWYSKYWMNLCFIPALLSRVQQQDTESKENLIDILRNLVAGYEVLSEFENTGCGFLIRYNLFARWHLIAKICEQYFESRPPDIEFFCLFEEEINKLSYQLIK